MIILVLVAAAILAIVYLAGSGPDRLGRDEEAVQEEAPAGAITESADPGQDDHFKADGEPFSTFSEALNNEKPLVLYFYSRT